MSAASTSIVYLGLDVHKTSILIAVLPTEATTPTRVDKLPHDLKLLRRYCARLAKAGELHACYEASGAGYVLLRAMRSWGHQCELIAPSLIPQKPGHQRKHDRYDATQLARLYRAGELTVVHVPTEAEERVRDVVRCRETIHKEVHRARQYVLKFLTRRGWRYTEGRVHWTKRHHAWVRAVLRDSALPNEDRIVLGEYVAWMDYAEQRQAALDREIAAQAVTPAYQAPVARVASFRGLDTQAAMVLVSEVGDWRRFARATQAMAYVGLVPREASSGERERKGAITKMGNSHCRHVLVQAAWSYRYPPNRSPLLCRRQAGQPAEVVAHSWKAQHRLHRLYRQLALRKGTAIAVVAVARELVGFVWAALQEEQLYRKGARVEATA